MANKTERIISYLPSTFAKQPAGQTLHAVVDAFGRELQEAENSLAAVMQAHWVDHADRLASVINDLARIAALYGLAPRTDEGVEEFREHLKRYVRTFLDGTVTVQGILRITAEALGLHLADDYTRPDTPGGIDTWWTRPHDGVTFREPAGNDAANLLFGISSANQRGRSAAAASVRGTPDLSGGVDCTSHTILRLAVDDTGPFEIDVAAGAEDRSNVSGAEIIAAINAEVGQEVALFDSRHLTLTSPTRGPQSVLEVQDVNDDAADKLLGLAPRAYSGRDEQAAQVRGVVDLSGVLDLSESRYLRLLIDGEHLAEIDVAGPDETHTLLDQVVEQINTALGLEAVTHDGRFLILTSPTTGLGSSIVFQQAAAQQALLRLFGPISKTHIGRGPTAAQVTSRRDLSGGLDLTARYLLHLAVDGRPPLTIDLRTGVEDIRQATLRELADTIDAAVDSDIAATDGQHLILVSPSTGSGSSLALEPLWETQPQRFVSQALITDEAAQAVLGFTRRTAVGQDATNARVTGRVDAHRGADLRENRFLRLVIDQNDPVEIDLGTAGARPRATLIDEIVTKINKDLAMTPPPAAHNGRRLILSSPTTGPHSHIRFEPPLTADALPLLLGVEPGEYRGENKVGVRFVGTADLSGGVDLSEAGRVKIGLDDAEPIEIDCTANAANPQQVNLNEIIIALNLGLGQNVATHDGRFVIIASPLLGAGSHLRFLPPETGDATRAIFGIDAPREYHGRDATAAEVIGQRDLSNGENLQLIRYLRIGVDGAAPQDVDCLLPNAADPANVTLDEIVAAINGGLDAKVAHHDGTFLILTSPTEGAGSRITLAEHSSGDARPLLFGDVPLETTGQAATPATILGEADLLRPVNLQTRRLIRLTLDGAPPVDIDVAGVSPATTVLSEIVNAINQRFPGMASATADHRLLLTAPSTGRESRLEALPLRTLDLIEYPPHTPDPAVHDVHHGLTWHLSKPGASGVSSEVRLHAAQGVSGPTLVNETLGWRVRLLVGLGTGGTARLWVADGRLYAETQHGNHPPQPVPPDRILAGPIGAQAWVPFSGEWPLSETESDIPALQLNDPPAADIVQLIARRAFVEETVHVAAVESTILPVDVNPVAQDGQTVVLNGRIAAPTEDEPGYRLLGGADEVLAELRAGPGVDLGAYAGSIANVIGTIHPAGDNDPTPPLLIVQRLEHLFDVTISGTTPTGEPLTKAYERVTIGHDPAAANALVRHIQSRPSRLVRARSLPKAQVLTVPQGRSTWRFLDCYGPRFDYARFDQATFPGGTCPERGIFNISHFAQTPPDPVAPVFVSLHDRPDPPVRVEQSWVIYRPGAFTVRLPADLPPRFGGRFNQDRFGQGHNKPELYERAVTEPPSSDPPYIVAWLNEQSSLVEAQIVNRVPLGWQAVALPFREPRLLTLGDEHNPAQIYLTDTGIPGFLRLQAREPGEWGNQIAVAARASGPAMFDFSVYYAGVPFENARQTVLGQPLSELTLEALQPGPAGVLQAKAAGVHVQVVRERTPEK